MKIRITGGSGSGKSYLGRRIANHTKTPLTSMDDIVFSTKYTERRSKKDINKLITKVLSKRKWIIEGGWYSIEKRSYEEADILIYLRPTFTRRMLNTVKRFLKNRQKNFLSLTLYNLKSRKKWQEERYELFKQYKNFHSFTSADEAFEWFTQE